MKKVDILSAPISSWSSFTLIELLIVIAILAVLSAVAILFINPAELLKQSRDSRRLNDISTINRALGLLKADCPACSLGSANTVYVSIPDTSPTCANLGLPSLLSGWSYACVTQANLLKTDGSGWIPVDFSKFSAGSPLAKLPVDPVNTTSSGNYYTYVTGGSWALSALLESQRHLKESAAKDGGYNPGKFEVGTNLQLIAQSEGLVGWWPFDEGSGTIAKDQSGNNNTGTLTNGPTWTTGKVGGALSFDGVDDYVNVINSASINTSLTTVLAYIKYNSVSNVHAIIQHMDGCVTNGYFLTINRVTSCTTASSDSKLWLVSGSNSINPGDFVSNSTASTDWNFIGFVWDTNKQKLFINGRKDVERTLSITTPSSRTSNLLIGMLTNLLVYMEIQWSHRRSPHLQSGIIRCGDSSNLQCNEMTFDI